MNINEIANMSDEHNICTFNLSNRLDLGKKTTRAVRHKTYLAEKLVSS